MVGQLGVNFINVLCADFTCADPKSAKKTVKLSFFSAFGIWTCKSCSNRIGEIDSRWCFDKFWWDMFCLLSWILTSKFHVALVYRSTTRLWLENVIFTFTWLSTGSSQKRGPNYLYTFFYSGKHTHIYRHMKMKTFLSIVTFQAKNLSNTI